MVSRKPIIVVQGGQWGSEAKGNIAAHLCLSRNVEYAVRTGAINAGHTVIYNGERFAMQQLPTGWVNPNTQLVIGAGAYIHPDTLWREIDAINRAMPGHDVRERLFIDRRCGIHNEAAEAKSKVANRHHSIGATGKGCSEAIVAKIRDRNNGYQLFYDTDFGRTFRDHNMGRFTMTDHMLNCVIDDGAQVLIEGTQGTLLDLHLGPYPFTTSRMTTAANWVAECGLSPALDYEVVLVVRTFPIRVAGNSGPMSNEIEWLDLASSINRKLETDGFPHRVSEMAMQEFASNLQTAASNAVHGDRYKVPLLPTGHMFNTRTSSWDAPMRSIYRVAASELNRDALLLCNESTVVELKKLFEMTTVTKKLRRLAQINIPDLRESIAINRPSWIALTFADYIEPLLANMTVPVVELAASDHDDPHAVAIRRLRFYIEKLERDLRVPVRMVSAGPELFHVLPTASLDPISER